MDVEIEYAELVDKTIEIYAIDTSQLRLDYLERNRAAEEMPREIEFRFDLENPRTLKFVIKFLNAELAVKQAREASKTPFTWGQALRAIQGVNTVIPGKFRVFD